MSASVSREKHSVQFPWWIRWCRWLWKAFGFLGTAVILNLVVSFLATCFTTTGCVAANTLLGRMVTCWYVTLPVGCCLLLIAVLIGMLSRWPLLSPRVPLARQNRTRP